eukprot:COSAG02_NODE_7961_length_2771_cov_1.845808_3_plen_173_part_00
MAYLVLVAENPRVVVHRADAVDLGLVRLLDKRIQLVAVRVASRKVLARQIIQLAVVVVQRCDNIALVAGREDKVLKAGGILAVHVLLARVPHVPVLIDQAEVLRRDALNLPHRCVSRSTATPTRARWRPSLTCSARSSCDKGAPSVSVIFANQASAGGFRNAQSRIFEVGFV